MAARRGVGLWHAFCTAITGQARRKRMPWLAANSDLSFRSFAYRTHYVLLTKHSFSFSPALGTHGAQKRAKAHIPGLVQDHARVSLIVSGFPTCAQCGPRRPAYSMHGSAVSLRAARPGARRLACGRFLTSCNAKLPLRRSGGASMGRPKWKGSGARWARKDCPGGRGWGSGAVQTMTCVSRTTSSMVVMPS